MVQNFAPVNSLEDKKYYPARLKEERKRLGLTQTRVAEICGSTKGSVINWEKKTPIPSDKLALLMPHGFDALYVLAGRRVEDDWPSNLSWEERTLVDNYRRLSRKSKDQIRGYIDALRNRDTEGGRVPEMQDEQEGEETKGD